MPSGAKKRKAAKRKKLKASNNSISLSKTSSHHGESDGGELSSPASQGHNSPRHPVAKAEAVQVDKREDNSSSNKSITTGSTEKAAKDGNSEIDKGSKLKKSYDSSSCFSTSSSDNESHAIEKKVVVLDPAPVESLPEQRTHKVESSVESSPFVDSVKAVDSRKEVASQVCDETKHEEKNDSVVAKASLVAESDKSSLLEQKVNVNESASKDNCSTSSVVVESVPKENGNVKLPSLDEKASAESKDSVAASTYPKGSVSGVNGTDHVNESETPEYSDRQPLVASAPRQVETSSWKNCCGILELFSSSDR